MRSVLVVAALFVGSICDAGMEQEFVCRHCGLKGTYVQAHFLPRINSSRSALRIASSTSRGITISAHRSLCDSMAACQFTPVRFARSRLHTAGTRRSVQDVAAKTSESARPEWPLTNDTPNQALERTAACWASTFQMIKIVSVERVRSQRQSLSSVSLGERL